ncbi:hypothetical protein NDU88_006063 [Pleurodeles waltl]|uniref:Uncharacterized protein n=1 Tax=Pleurodeles waltl TaxID=8319 RepID=A0AAV7MC79_PLEWA|nr:hypothetical protein NDU88_006063 [Pleurodeles waltl]
MGKNVTGSKEQMYAGNQRREKYDGIAKDGFPQGEKEERRKKRGTKKTPGKIEAGGAQGPNYSLYAVQNAHREQKPNLGLPSSPQQPCQSAAGKSVRDGSRGTEIGQRHLPQPDPTTPPEGTARQRHSWTRCLAIFYTSVVQHQLLYGLTIIFVFEQMSA